MHVTETHTSSPRTACRPASAHAGGQTSLPGDFLRSLRSLLSAAAASPPSAAELSAAKAETLNSFAFNFSSTSSQLQRILVYDLLGLPQVGWGLRESAGCPYMLRVGAAFQREGAGSSGCARCTACWA